MPNVPDELMDNRDKAVLAERVTQKIKAGLSGVLDEPSYQALEWALFILAEVRHAAQCASELVDPNGGDYERSEREHKKAEILERLWRAVVTDGLDCEV
ncbi:hypothetical protein [Aquabacterium olei]|uniref:hypothetical protein n=1 Tax=Aquabacterium olei TaxID=1296669 RepID=UPI00131F30FF|nr:hypothetical protein [Aquabacterium olei]